MTLASHCWCESLRFPSRPLWESGKLLGAATWEEWGELGPLARSFAREGRVEVLTSPEDIEAIMPRLTADAVKMLAQQLRSLEADGIVVRTIHNQVPPKVEYRLTAWGQSLCPALDALLAWLERRQGEMEPPSP